MAEHGTYHIPHHSAIPIISAIGLFFFGLGSIEIFTHFTRGLIFLGIGGLILVANLISWFATTIRENRTGLHGAQMGRTYYWGMFWFLFAQGALALTVLGAMFYVRTWALPWMSGQAGDSAFQVTHLLLWPNFEYSWPLLDNPAPKEFIGPHGTPNPWGLPLIGTILMVISAFSLMLALYLFKQHKRKAVILCLFITFALSVVFSALHIYSFIHAVTYHNILPDSGIYGSLFYMINFVLCLNLFIGMIFLFVVTLRTAMGHFDLNDQFSLKSVSWLWYFVVVLWLIIFLYVYVA